MASNPAAASTSVFVQFYNNGVTNVAVNGFPAVTVQNPPGHQHPLPVGSVQMSTSELRSIREAMNTTSHDELKTLLEVMCQMVPGAKEFMGDASARIAALRNQALRGTPAAAAPPGEIADVVVTAAATAPPEPSSASGRAAAGAAPAYSLYPCGTIGEVWKEWTEGMDGWPPLKQLEARWGAQLRPTGRQRVAWSRRKGILDELSGMIKKRREQLKREGEDMEEETEEETEKACIEELEDRRGDRSLHALLLEILALKSRAASNVVVSAG